MTLSLFLIEVAIEMLFKLDSKVVFFFCVELEHEAQGEHPLFTILLLPFEVGSLEVTEGS